MSERETIRIVPGAGIPEAEVSYKEPTGKVFRLLGQHKQSDEEYLFWLCVLTLEIDGAPQEPQWWEEIPMRELHRCIRLAQESMPKYQESIEEDRRVPLE